MTDLLRDTLQEWSDEAQVPHDLADRALRRRVRRPVIALVAVAALALAVTVPVVRMSGQDQVATVASPKDVRVDAVNDPPKTLIAAGDYAVSSYVVPTTEKLTGKMERRRWTWWLYNPTLGEYEKTPWAWLDVAPGMERAAVLEGDGLGSRLGILDMNTRQVTTWIDLEHGAGAVKWSPDGSKLVLTTYTGFPEQWERRGKNTQLRQTTERTGFYVVDPATAQATHHPLPPTSDGPGSGRQDARWSLDGTLIAVAAGAGSNPWVYYSPDGQEQPAPSPGDDELSYGGVSRVSPDGRLLLGEAGLPTKITDRQTGAVVGTQQVMQLLAWADNERVIAMACVGTCPFEFAAYLALVSVDGSQVVRLSADQDNTTKDGSWHPVLTRR